MRVISFIKNNKRDVLEGAIFFTMLLSFLYLALWVDATFGY